MHQVPLSGTPSGRKIKACLAPVWGKWSFLQMPNICLCLIGKSCPMANCKGAWETHLTGSITIWSIKRPGGSDMGQSVLKYAILNSWPLWALTLCIPAEEVLIHSAFLQPTMQPEKNKSPITAKMLLTYEAFQSFTLKMSLQSRILKSFALLNSSGGRLRRAEVKWVAQGHPASQWTNQK